VGDVMNGMSMINEAGVWTFERVMGGFWTRIINEPSNHFKLAEAINNIATT
jgi:hypothetical protein